MGEPHDHEFVLAYHNPGTGKKVFTCACGARCDGLPTKPPPAAAIPVEIESADDLEFGEV